MKILIASDVHGSYFALKKVLERVKSENANKLILLGDVYNHGPRNPFPAEYAPMDVASALNSIKGDLIVIKGNCDSAVDTMISEFDFIENACLVINGKTVFLTHGHVYNKDAMPKTKYDAVIYGHFHTGFIEEKDGAIVANAGSISLPKNGTSASYILIDENGIALKDLDGKILQQKKF